MSWKVGSVSAMGLVAICSAVSTSGRVKPVGVYVEEVLKGYFPTGTAILTGIGA